MDAAVEPLLAVADLDRSLAFWVDGVGAAVVTRWDTYALLDLGRGRLHLALTGEPPPDRDVRLVPPAGPDATAAVVLQVADCRATVAELEARGVTFLGPPSEPGWGDEVRAFARDPDGHIVEITSGS